MGNALRHAQAREVVVSLSHDDDELLLEVADDGIGFAANQVAGTGLLAMRERAAQAGGRVAIDAAPGAGTRVRVRMPFQA